MFNSDIRFYMKNANVKVYQLAAKLGISASWLSKLLNRSELPEAKKNYYIKVIENFV